MDTATERIPADKRFVRDGVTWLGYILMSTSTFVFATLGPLMPFMRAELKMDLTTAAYHFSAWSLGGLIAGCGGDRVINRCGRFLSVWISAAIVCICLGTFVSAHTPFLTVPAALVAGMCAAVIGMAINSLMSDRFGGERAIGITEANICASLVCCVAPLAVSACVRMNYGWRIALVLPIFIYAVSFLALRHIPDERAANSAQAAKPGSLPAAYWAYWAVLLFNVPCEWSMVLWSAEFLEHAEGLARADAAAAVSAFLSAMVVGRLIGRKLSATCSTHVLLPCAAVVALCGFALFWLGHVPAISIPGMFLTGLGISNFYPLSLSAALEVAKDQSTTASARMSVGTGCSVLAAPLALGFVADHQGVFAAYGIVGALLSLCMAMVFVANHCARRHAEQERLVVVPD